jgi:hypothetical protein
LRSLELAESLRTRFGQDKIYTAPAALLFAIQHRLGPCSNKSAKWRFWMCLFAAGWARMTLNDARSATLQCSRCARRVLSDQALDRLSVMTKHGRVQFEFPRPTRKGAIRS